MSSTSDARTGYDEHTGEPTQRSDHRHPSPVRLRAAILAGLIVATTGGGVPVQGVVDDPVRIVSGTSTTCCPPTEG
ncbi:hypothetical protein Misp04_43200 [Micromonospora sp. NBRC 101691]|nr:hypothetical protein Misp04_43200 [Micromonospora sp. NBRC 101691]